MSWSHSFTGKLSVLKDSAYRLPIIINIDDIGSNNDNFISNLKALFKLNFLHIILNVPLYFDITYNFNDFINSMQLLYSLQHDVEATDGVSIMLTLKISIITMLEVFIDLISAHYLHFDIILLQIDDKGDQKHQQQQEYDQSQLNIQGQQYHHHHQIDKNNKNEIIDNIIMISNLLKDIFNNQSLSFTLGICNIRSLVDLDWYLIKMPIDIIQFIHLGSFQLPNIRTRWIELIYTQGINVWYDMMIDDDNVIISSSSSSDIINQLSQKYQVSSMTFLVKCLLQLGIIVSIPMIINQKQQQHHHLQQQQQIKHNLQYITEQYSRLVHPFNYRKLFVSAVKIISLRIDYTDIKVITDISDEIECSIIDEEWKPYIVSNAIEPRQLKY